MTRDPSAQLKEFKDAFEQEYTALHPNILLTTMDLYTPGKIRTYYNCSFPIIQSSGMGKSRLVDHSATLRFTIPFNLGEKLPGNVKTYPPADANVRKYLTAQMDEDYTISTRHYAFLESLFTQTVFETKSYTQDTPQNIALKWYIWMKEGSKSTNVGTNRSQFYDRVIEKAKQVFVCLFLENQDFTLEDRAQRLLKAALKFSSHLKTLHGDVGGQFRAIVYFDEAHTLNTQRDLDSYFALMRVLNQIVKGFLSVGSRTILDGPYPPFFEVPFDTFCRNFSEQAKKEGVLTLEGVCQIEQMSKFGRPMWYSHFLSTLDVKDKDSEGVAIHPTISLAMTKLGFITANPNIQKIAELAALDSRVLLQFDPYKSRNKQSEMIQSFMRCVFAIPKSREYMWSGYPSEPMLSEAAARLLNGNELHERKIAHTAPKILHDALSSGFLAKGERGEMVARLLLTIAHDLAVIRDHPEPSYGPHFHRPVPLLVFLSELFSAEIWQKVRTAKPVHDYPNSKTLEDACSHGWVNFSHFVLLGDFESFEFTCARDLLKRGSGMQTWNNQRNQDIGISVHFGKRTSKIKTKRTSVVQFQIKNTKTAASTSPNASLIGRVSEELPIISIVMQLRVKDPKERVSITTTAIKDNPAGNTRQHNPDDDIEGRHYIITVYGCTSKTYGCVPKELSGTYASLLMTPDPFQDMPRADQKENRDAYYSLKPALYKSKSTSFCW